MAFTKSARTDMVISMTLAELFLMLMFVVWYGFTPRWSQADVAKLEDTVHDLTKEVTDARAKLAENETTMRDLTARLVWWRTHHPDEVPAEGKGSGSGGPGLPKCDPARNVLVEVGMHQGQLSMRVLSRPDALAKVFVGGSAYPPVGEWLLDSARIQAFLDEMRRQNLQSGCRWNYRLYYETKVDYFDGREQFENVFYPGRIVASPRPE